MSDVDASLPLQKAVVAVLKSDAALQTLIGTGASARVFDNVPTTAAKPYISLGPTQLNAEIAAEYEGSEERFQVDAWSAGPGKVEVKRIGRAIHTALNGVPLTLDENQRLVLIEIEQTRYLTEPDGITQHAALIFVAHTEPSA